MKVFMVFIHFFNLLFIGFGMSNLIRLGVVRKYLKRTKREADLINESKTMTDEVKCIILDRKIKEFEMIDNFSYFVFPFEKDWKERRAKKLKVRKVIKALKKINK